jgi:hypothetical protein
MSRAASWLTHEERDGLPWPRAVLACARQHYQHALSLYTCLGMPDADQLRAYLTTINGESKETRDSGRG